MSDYEELKKAAEASIALEYFAPEPYDEDRAYRPAELAWLEFVNLAKPEVVLALIAELKDFQQGAKVEADSVDEARAEVAKLKAENESLRKDAERLDFIESKNNMRLSFRKNHWSFIGFTNYEYPVFRTVREAIDSAISSEPF